MGERETKWFMIRSGLRNDVVQGERTHGFCEPAGIGEGCGAPRRTIEAILRRRLSVLSRNRRGTVDAHRTAFVSDTFNRAICSSWSRPNAFDNILGGGKARLA